MKYLAVLFSMSLLITSCGNLKESLVDLEGQTVMFFIGGGDGAFTATQTVFVSKDDGATWTEVGTNSFPAAIKQCQAANFDGKLWVVGGDGSDKVYSTANGVDWTDHGSVLPTTLKEFDLIEYNGAFYTAGGHDGTTQVDKIFKSTDMINWTDTTHDLSIASGAVPAMSVFNGKIWIAGGQNGGQLDNVYSYDGTTLLTSADASVTDLIAGGSWGTAYTLGSSLYVTIGFSDAIYSTVDGVTWVDEKATNAKVLPAALWTADILQLDNKVYMAGGYVAGTVQTAIYESTNGVDWVKSGDLPAGRGQGCISTLKVSDISGL